MFKGYVLWTCFKRIWHLDVRLLRGYKYQNIIKPVLKLSHLDKITSFHVLMIRFINFVVNLLIICFYRTIKINVSQGKIEMQSIQFRKEVADPEHLYFFIYICKYTIQPNWLQTSWWTSLDLLNGHRYRFEICYLLKFSLIDYTSTVYK